MGVTRKLASTSTLGLIDFRSDKERIARNTKKTYKLEKQKAKDERKAEEGRQD